MNTPILRSQIFRVQRLARSIQSYARVPVALLIPAINSYRKANSPDKPKDRELSFVPYISSPFPNFRNRVLMWNSWLRWGLIIFTIIFISLMSFFSTMLILVGHAVLPAMLMVAAGVAAAFPGYIVFLRGGAIVCDEFGIKVPLRNNWRRMFWSDLQEVSIVDTARSGNSRHRFAIKLSGKRNSKIFIQVAKLPPGSAELLSKAIERRAPFCRNLSQFAEVPRFQDYEKGILQISYAQLWESLTNKTIGLTAFAPLKPGFKLQNDCLTVVRQLSSGGFSAVYLVEDTDGAKFVLKESVLPFGVEESLKAKASEQFDREATLLKQLTHSQIARVFDHFLENGRNYMLLEYIPGETLRQRVYERGPQQEHLVLSWAIQIASILQYLHERPVPTIHRDIAPDNLIVTDSGKIFLIDFGSANEFVGAATGTLVGKHGYMAPEQIRGKASPLSDIYSLGQTLYFCLTGTDPVPLKSASFAVDRPNNLSNLKLTIIKTTSLEASERPASCASLLSELTNLEGEVTKR
jgi:tRNA A-37 threonylcarbamoyl transferase component Bud32